MMTLALLILLQQQFGMAVWRGPVLAYDDLFAFLAYRVAFSEVRVCFFLLLLLRYFYVLPIWEVPTVCIDIRVSVNTQMCISDSLQPKMMHNNHG